MMNLKTHTGYPEIQVDEDFTWVAKIIGGSGMVLKEFTSNDFDGDDANSRPEASEQASIMIAGVEDDYLRPVEKEEEVITPDDVGTLEVDGGAA